MKPFYLFSSLVIVFIAFALGSCNINRDRIKPSKNYISRNYKVTEFSELELSTVGDVYFTQSANGETSLEIYGPDNIVDLYEVSIENNTLHLTMQNKNRVHNVKKLKIMISSPNLNSLKFDGVGNVNIPELLSLSKFLVAHHGVGDVNIKSLHADELTVNSTGVGNLNLEGEANRVSLTSRGVGNIEAGKLKGNVVDAASKGVGNITCYATESIAASVEGVGNISYKGSPASKSVSKNGIGSIKEF